MKITTAKFARSAPMIIVILIALFYGGELAWRNVRPNDPLPFGFENYTAAAFRASQEAGESIMVEVYASWCPTCMKQHEVLETLLMDPAYKNVRGFRVDYDVHDNFLERFNVKTQSTIITFRGNREISRTVGLVQTEPILAQIDTILPAGTALARAQD